MYKNCFILWIYLIQGTYSFAQPAIEWSKCFGSSSKEEPTFMQLTNDGGFIIVGEANVNGGDVSGHHGGSSPDYWVVKTDSVGNLQWQKCLVGPQVILLGLFNKHLIVDIL
ncbi:MAG: hypothetical protein IPP71_20885 [Bacteroidetes bacterium]|nr:hypothetical protein [Bacteroidota bacterium]